MFPTSKQDPSKPRIQTPGIEHVKVRNFRQLELADIIVESPTSECGYGGKVLVSLRSFVTSADNAAGSSVTPPGKPMVVVLADWVLGKLPLEFNIGLTGSMLESVSVMFVVLLVDISRFIN